MTNAARNAQLLARIADDARATIDQARTQRALIDGTIGRDPFERFTRLLLRATAHKAAGRPQAAAAAARMARRILALIPE